MKPYIEKLKTYLAENPPDYGDCDARSVLEMLYTYYSQYNCLDTPQIKSDFEALYQQLTGKSLRELDTSSTSSQPFAGTTKNPASPKVSNSASSWQPNWQRNKNSTVLLFEPPLVK